jgi:hypothetical protein
MSHRFLRLNSAALTRVILENLDPLFANIESKPPEQLDIMIEALFSLACELIGKDLLGEKSHLPLINRLFGEMLPQLLHILPEDPSLAGRLCNAIYKMEQSNANAAAWLDKMLQGSKFCQKPAELLALGQVLAWRFGMAHYRISASEIWRQMPKALAAFSFDLSLREYQALSGNLDEILANPWCPISSACLNSEAASLALVGTVGGFIGFRGFFISPPEVTCAAGQLYAFDSQMCYSLHADCYGVTLRRFGNDIPENAGQKGDNLAIDTQGKVHKHGASAQFTQLASCLSQACDGHTLAVTMPYSHKIYLIAEQHKF